ncbi:hypothetical protein Tco_1196401 [Tanacetum coccineum]
MSPNSIATLLLKDDIPSRVSGSLTPIFRAIESTPDTPLVSQESSTTALLLSASDNTIDDQLIYVVPSEVNSFINHSVLLQGLVPRPHGKNIIVAKWIYKNKVDEDGDVISNKEYGHHTLISMKRHHARKFKEYTKKGDNVDLTINVSDNMHVAATVTASDKPNTVALIVQEPLDMNYEFNAFEDISCENANDNVATNNDDEAYERMDENAYDLEEEDDNDFIVDEDNNLEEVLDNEEFDSSSDEKDGAEKIERT